VKLVIAILITVPMQFAFAFLLKKFGLFLWLDMRSYIFGLIGGLCIFYWTPAWHRATSVHNTPSPEATLKELSKATVKGEYHE
jgi:hypothetical protein